MHEVVLSAALGHAWYYEFAWSRVVGFGAALGLNDHAVYFKARLGPLSLTVGHRSQ